MLISNIVDITEPIADQIRVLQKNRVFSQPEIERLKKEFDPKKHDVLDPGKRPDKPILNDDGQVSRMEKVNRISYPLQKTIVRTAVSFAFGNPLALKCDPKGDGQKKVLIALKRIFHDNKTTSFNRTIGRELFRATEVAECWYAQVQTAKHNDYGFPTQTRIKVQKFSPWAGDLLYPYFDETGDLKAFSRGFSRQLTADTRVEYFETYTDEQYMRWKKEPGSEWVEEKSNVLTLGKIPVIYGRQEQAEWEDVEPAIERLEYLLSNFADVIDYHAAPTIYVEGEVEGFAEKGEAGKLIEGQSGSKAYYLSWQFAPDAVKLEIETLLKIVFACTQTPDISFDSVKGMQEISGEALKMLFMDAHLKVQDKREVLDAYFQRRINVVKAFVGKIGSIAADASELVIEPEIEPYIIGIDADRIANLTAANGGKPIISQKTSVSLSGLVENAQSEFDQIQKEAEADATTSVFEPAQA